MSGLVISTKNGFEYVVYVGEIIRYDPDEKLVLSIFRDSIRDNLFKKEITALYDMKSFQNPELVDQYFCWCCVVPKETHVTRFKKRNIIQITKTSSTGNIALNLENSNSLLFNNRKAMIHSKNLHV